MNTYYFASPRFFSDFDNKISRSDDDDDLLVILETRCNRPGTGPATPLPSKSIVFI